MTVIFLHSFTSQASSVMEIWKISLLMKIIPGPCSFSSQGNESTFKGITFIVSSETRRAVIYPKRDATIHIKVFKGVFIVHALPTLQVSTFGEYGSIIFLPWIKQQLNNCSRVVIVWDTYKEYNIKQCTREKSGKGTRESLLGN